MKAPPTPHLVTGAPGSGKTTSAQTLLELGSEVLSYDSDWLLAAVRSSRSLEPQRMGASESLAAAAH